MINEYVYIVRSGYIYDGMEILSVHASEIGALTAAEAEMLRDIEHHYKKQSIDVPGVHRWETGEIGCEEVDIIRVKVEQ